MELHQAANDFLIEARFERGLSQSTVTTYAWALYDYLSWVEANGHAWEDPWLTKSPRCSLLAEYRKWQVKLSEICQRPSERTIRFYLKICDQFYRWAEDSKLLIGATQQPNAESENSNLSVSAWRHGLRLEGRRPLRLPIKVLSIGDIQRAVAAAKTHTCRLMIVLGLSTGLRRSEIISFPKDLIFDPIPGVLEVGSRLPVELHQRRPGAAGESLMQLKGGVSRKIFVPATVMRALYEYCAFGERVAYERKYSQKYGSAPERLFISRLGEPYGKKYLNQACKQIGDASGLHVHPHMLRHTFAAHELAQESQRRTPTNALIWLRDRLGHASIETTTIYTNLLSELDDTVITQYQTMLSGLADGRRDR
jgi:integrase